MLPLIQVLIAVQSNGLRPINVQVSFVSASVGALFYDSISNRLKVVFISFVDSPTFWCARINVQSSAVV